MRRLLVLFLSLSVMLLAGAGATVSLVGAAPPAAVAKAPARMVICPEHAAAPADRAAGRSVPSPARAGAAIAACPPIALPHPFCCPPERDGVPIR